VTDVTDITILGAGIFGLSIAWAAVRRGARVTVIDPHGPGAGASGGLVGALAPHAPEQWNAAKAFQLRSLLMAESWWAEVAATGGKDPLYARSGRLQPLGQRDLAEARALSAATLWEGMAQWTLCPAADFGHWLPGETVIHDTLAARIAPRAALAALTATIIARGGAIVTDAPHRGLVLHATGHAGLASDLGQPIKGQAALLAHDARDLPQIYADGLHIVPHGDGTTAIGSTTERDRTDTKTDDQLDAVIARARAIVPALANAPVIARWAGLRPRTTTRQPILGPHPHHPGQFIANGGFKTGFGLAPLVGETMADLLLDGRDMIPDEFRA
jgi:glycine/D-amino acid oxidase-like deaminating enzyme